jgi:hypothetical protein
MPMKQIHDNQRLERILDSLEGIRRADPAPFLYTRIKARMEKSAQPAWERITGVLSRPWVATCLALILIAANAYIVLNARSGASDQITDDHLFASNPEYATHTSFYESNPEWP